ncbi:exonuclease subunit SbcD [Candidatus Dependentiae bacterium]|nr:exonuclease subunit SbcD [Candidatus Dependentiae bacterium]
MIRFIHTADIHFGMENYGRIDPKTGIHSRLIDFEKALNFCIDFALEKEVDFFLFSGDAYKTAHPTPTHQRLLMSCFLRLYKAGIPIVIVVGNHDNPLSFGKAHALEIFGQIPLDGFHVIAKPTSFVLPTKSGPVQIVGIPWPTRNTLALSDQHSDINPHEITEYISSGVSRIIASFAEALDSSLPAVLAGHLTVSSGIFSGSEKRAIYGTDPFFLPSQLGIAPFDYVALGHLHRFQNVNGTCLPPIVYSGSIERVDFGERKEEKGFCYVTIHEKEEVTYEFIKTPTRSLIQIEVQLNEVEAPTEQILQEIERHTITNAIIKILYFLPAHTKDSVDISRVQKACVGCWYLVGIFPVHKQETRERRAAIKTDMNLEQLLTAYFDTKPEYAEQKKNLIEKALLIETEFLEKNFEL